MAGFEIGQVVSPVVAAALTRAGERASQGGGGIRRRDPIRRTSTKGATTGEQVAVLREARAAKEQEARLAAQERAEGFQRERFAASQSDADRRFGLAEEGLEQAGRRITAQEGANVVKLRDQGTSILSKIGSTLDKARKINTETGKADPEKVRDAMQVVSGLWQQYQSLGLPAEEVAAMEQRLKLLVPSSPAARGQGGPPPGVNRQGTPARAGEPQVTAGDVADSFQRDNPDPAGPELIAALQQHGALDQLPQGAQLHNDGTMTLLNGERVPIMRFLSQQGGGASTVESGLSRELSTPNRTP